MLSVLAVVLPVFGLILAGWLARRTGMLGPRAVGELNRFVVYLALPALLFELVATAHISELWQPDFVAAFGVGTAVVFVVALVIGRFRGRPLSDTAIDGLNASYANVGFIGIPLALATLGRPSMIPTLIATLLTVCVLFAMALVLVEVGLQSKGHPGQMLLKVLRQLARNPLLIAPALGTLVMVSGLTLPAPALSFLSLLGAAASPCALICLGLFLAQRRSAPEGGLMGLGELVALKLLLHPLLTWILATQVFGLSPALTHCAVLLAALPTGTGPFMVAQHYRRDGALTSSTILVTTVLSVITITAYLMWAPT